MAVSILQRFRDIDQQARQAAETVAADQGASAPLQAVVHEFQQKTQGAVEHLQGADERTIRDHIIGVHQAADITRRAAEAEPAIELGTRDAVLGTHAQIRALKEEIVDLK